ncbi:hypothetical protein MOC16_gp291 [Klebsiella phage vB_KpM_FBKp24]|uniref:Uncharacterized protein n=1 Tax=Klebsiella phage vB_KpM_FBKp24 TaxID=2801834 RepID=A0A7U0J6A4_9CAUD|nr:hypothetical protein [Klebsiella pneumoniae]YP_010298759.1 hypothetical protein MOC16_gp291 [Klebsiella phage vB_KpM_FBKp24]QQV92140.1 hypothetical protein vBKpMFBKp24_122 [Klebsiella phage vB_KpM_FBKp24]
MKKVMFVFDLDDTKFETEKAMTRWINDTFNCGLVWKNRLSRTDPFEAPFLKAVLEDGSFMEHADWVPGFEALPALIKEMQTVFGARLQTMFATHRGYHPRAAEFTQRQFDRLGVEMEGVFLDPEKVPCKKTWLDANLKGYDYYLFDDNPHWGGTDASEVSNVFLMDKLWNQNQTAYQRLYGFDDVKQKMFDLAIKHLS